MILPPVFVTRLKLLSEQTRKWALNPRSMSKDVREELALTTAIIFNDFTHFAYVGMRFLGFKISDMQLDIADYMATCPNKAMVQAQRGEAKSTLAALYAVWCLIQNQQHKVLIVSAGETQASDVAVMIVRMIDSWHLLCWLKADPSRGDRTSYSGYDVHCDLKVLDKSPSVACIGITASLQGKRATILIPDDIESNKNGLTQTERDKILFISKDFTAICTHGKILYLGTPQTKDSIYKTLPSRGYDVKIWCGRIPSQEQEERYGDTLAPYIKGLIEKGYKRTGFGLNGMLGESTDTVRYSEADLNSKEADIGIESFQLQYMLDTSLSDANRTKVKMSDFIVFSGNHISTRNTFSWTNDTRQRVPETPQSIQGNYLYTPLFIGDIDVPYTQRYMVVDPAGCGGDEVSYAIGGSANSYIHLFSFGGYQGGVSTANIDKLIDLAIEFEVSDIGIENNMGHGTVEALFMNRIRERKLIGLGVTGITNTTQKERRIIDTISPITRRHRLILHTRAIEDDTSTCMQYPLDRRWQYSGLQQLSNITYDRGCLTKDDRADAIAMLVQKLSASIVKSEEEVVNELQLKERQAFVKNPMEIPKKFLQPDSADKRSGKMKQRKLNNYRKRR